MTRLINGQMSSMEMECVEYSQSEPIPFNKYDISINHLWFETFRFNLNTLISFSYAYKIGDSVQSCCP